MKGPNWIRLTLCGFVAGVIWHLLSVLFLSLFAPDLTTSLQRGALYARQGGAFFYAIDLLMGIWAVWLYSAIVPRYGAKPRTALIVGLAWWIVKTLQSGKWAGLGLMAIGPSLLPLAAATLVAAVLGAAAGSWLYGKVSEPSPRDIPAT
jgi:hypothetical protein